MFRTKIIFLENVLLTITCLHPPEFQEEEIQDN